MVTKNDFFLKCIITNDETLISAFDTETAQQSNEWCLKGTQN